MKSIICLIFMMCITSIFMAQDQSEEKRKEQRAMDAQREALRLMQEKSRKMNKLDERKKSEGEIEIKKKPDSSKNEKGVAKVYNNENYEEFEFEKSSIFYNSPEELGKTIHVHCPPHALNVGYSSMYLFNSEKFEDNFEIQTDWMLLVSLSLRGTIESDFDSHLTLFTGVNAVYFQVEYGFSGGDYQAIRIRRSFNFYLAQKGSFKEGLFADYTNLSDTHYHYQTFFSSIFIEPVIEYRIGRNGHDSEWAIGLAFGVSF